MVSPASTGSEMETRPVMILPLILRVMVIYPF